MTAFPSQSLFQIPSTTLASSDHSSVGRSRSKAMTRKRLSREPVYSRGKPSGSRVTEPLMMSPVRKLGRDSSPVSASRKWTALSYAPKATSVTPSGRSQTTGWPVHPDPHHVVVSPPTLDWPHMPPEGGYDHRVRGFSGTGPVPYQVRVGLPRNIVRPVTSPQGRPTVQSGTTSAGRSGNVVVVELVVLVVVSGPSVDGTTRDEVEATVAVEGVVSAAATSGPS